MTFLLSLEKTDNLWQNLLWGYLTCLVVCVLFCFVFFICCSGLCKTFTLKIFFPPLLLVPVSDSHMAASACQHSLSSFLPTGKQRDTRKIDFHLKPKALRTASKERPRSLVDLKAYKDTKILVAKFLEHSNCNLPPEVRHVVNSIRSVIKSDERHMEEAIFSANIIDQVCHSCSKDLLNFDETCALWKCFYSFE